MGLCEISIVVVWTAMHSGFGRLFVLSRVDWWRRDDLEGFTGGLSSKIIQMGDYWS